MANSNTTGPLSDGYIVQVKKWLAGTNDHEPSHIIGERSSYIDSIFASQPNLVVESGVQSSLNQNWHHQIVLCSLIM